jgi:hypothetical protein
MRKATVKTDAGNAISSAHCPNCGAPNTGLGTSGACDFCGAILNDGSHGWVLEQIIAPAQAQSLLQSVPVRPPINGNGGNIPSPAGVLAWMVQMAAVDGHVVQGELEMLTGVARNHNIPRERVDQMIRAALRNQLDTPLPATPVEAKSWLAEMARAALADGQISSQESQMLLATGSRVGMVEFDIKMLIKDLRGQMYREAKDALRSNRNGA